MDPGRDLEDRVALAFLERVLDDRARGSFLDLDAYLTAFPGHEERLREEWCSLHEASSPATSRRIGPYRLLEVLGRGGQGVVHLAHDERIGRTVALKLLHGVGLDGELPPRARRELEAIARLDHPGLCVVYEAGQHAGQAYLAMRYVPGRSLAALAAESEDTRRADPRAWRRQVLTWVEKLARALHSAHQVGVVHRDVKPGNVIVHESGEPVLLDFGLARSDDSAWATLTGSGELVGTTAYMSPERLAGELGIDPRADVWSLGVLLYELLTGQRPFASGMLEELSRAIRLDEPPDPRRLSPGLSRDLAVVLACALEKSPARRYATAEAFADDLRRVLEGRPVLAQPVSPGGRAWRWASRHPALAGLGLGMAASLALAVWAAFGFQRLATSEGHARRRAEALLVRSNTEQAELLSRDAVPGRRWTTLELLAEAGATREALGPSLPPEVPGLPRLRSLAAGALLQPDARPLRTIQRSSYGSGRFDARGDTVAMSWVSADLSVYGVRLLDMASGDELARLSDTDQLSTGFAVAVDGSARRMATVSRDVHSVVLWSLPDGARLADLAVPETLHPVTARSSWRLAFAHGDTLLVGVAAPATGADAPRGWAVWDLATARALLSDDPRAVGGAWCALSADERHLLLPGDGASLTWLELPTLVRHEVRTPAPVVVAAPGSRVGSRVGTRGGDDSDDADDAAAAADASAAGDVPRAGVDSQALRLLVVLREPGEQQDALAWLDATGRVLVRASLAGRAADEAVLALSPDERLLALALVDGAVLVADAVSLATLVVLPAGDSRPAEDLRLPGDRGPLLIHSGSVGTQAWELACVDDLVRRLPLAAEGPLAVSADGALLVVAPAQTGDPVSTWIASHGHQGPALAVPEGAAALSRLCVSSGGDRVAASDGRRAWTWDLSAAEACGPGRHARGGERAAQAPDTEHGGGDQVVGLAFDSGGRLVLLAASDDAGPSLTRVGGGPPRRLPADTADDTAVLGAAGERVLSVAMHDVQAPAILARGPLRVHGQPHESPVELQGLAPDVMRMVQPSTVVLDGPHVWAHVHVPRSSDVDGGQADDATLRLMLWDLPAGSLRWARPLDEEARDSHSAVSADGALAAVATAQGGIALLDGADGSELLRFTAHDGAPTWLQFVDGSARLLSRGPRGDLASWDLSALRQRLQSLELGF